jgi:signal transduction histidine kinase
MQLSASSDWALKPVTLMMERQMKHLVRLVDDLFDISRITRGKVSLRTERLSLQPLLEGAMEMSWTPAETERLELSVEMVDFPIDVEGDRDRLTQVFSNILLNAAKYTVGTGKVCLSLRREGREAVVRIQDSGVGIPTEALEHIGRQRGCGRGVETSPSITWPRGASKRGRRDRRRGCTSF